MDGELLARIMSNVEIVDNNCWLWRGVMNSSMTTPILRYSENGKRFELNARKLLYEHHVGNAPRNLPTTCGNSRCVNPAHVSLRKSNAEYCRRYYDRRKIAVGEKPIDRLRRLAKRCGFELRQVGKKRWRVECV